MLMDADNVILLAQCLITYICLSADSQLVSRSGQRSRSWSAKLLNFLICCTLYVFKHKKETRHKKVSMCIYVNKFLNKNVLFYDMKIVKMHVRIKVLKVLKRK